MVTAIGDRATATSSAIELDAEAVDPDDVELLQDMVLAAVTEAFRQAAALQQERMGAITGGLGGLGLPGF